MSNVTSIAQVCLSLELAVGYPFARRAIVQHQIITILADLEQSKLFAGFAMRQFFTNGEGLLSTR